MDRFTRRSTPNARRQSRATGRRLLARTQDMRRPRQPAVIRGYVERCVKSAGSEATKRVRFDRERAWRAPPVRPAGEEELDLRVFESR